MSDLVIVDDDRGVRTLTLNRPDKLNALSSELVDTLSSRLADAATDPEVRVVVLAGAGRSFCAGYDLDEPGGADGDPADDLRRSLDRLLEVFDHPRPVVAKVQGHCLAGGCDLMMMCDLAIASDDAVFGQPEIRFGSAVVALVMPWLVGARRAKEMLFTGEELDAVEAERIGLVNRVVPLPRLDEETMGLARRLAVVDPEVMRLSKAAVNAAWERSGFRQALSDGVARGGEIETGRSPERVEFDALVASRGLRHALEWRDRRFQV